MRSCSGQHRAGVHYCGTRSHSDRFPRSSIISGAPDALEPVRDLRATIFVDFLPGTREELARMGWAAKGSLGSDSSLLARDPDGALFVFVEIGLPPGDGGQTS